jgi:hypothetical protein
MSSSTLPPSFLFAGLDGETLKLSEELQALGGGDAKTCGMSLYCCINEKDEDDYQTLWDYDHSIGFRDISLPRSHPSSSNMHYFSVAGTAKGHSSSAAAASGNFANIHLMTDLSDQLLNWVHDGFNACIVTTGTRGTGKTMTLFGDIGKPSYHLSSSSSSSSSPTNAPMIQQIFNALFHHKNIAMTKTKSIAMTNSTSSSSILSIALSAWMLQENRMVDLMVPISTSHDPLDFACIECPDIHTTLQLLHEARSRAIGCLSWDSSQIKVDPNVIESQKAHFFCRILLHNRPATAGNSQQGVLSSLYIADLVGLTSIESKYFKSLSDSTKAIIRNRNLQLHSLFQIIKEMQEMSQIAATTHLTAGDQLQRYQPLAQTIKRSTSARNSKLTILLAPILQGNMKTTFLHFMKDGERYYQEQKNVFQQVIRVNDIQTACYKCKVSLVFVIFFPAFLKNAF